jgi:CheY-like chemotaxis protein
MLVALLEPLEFQMMTATNGVEAVQKAVAEPPDLVLLDFVMPGMDGLDTLKQLRTQAGCAATPMIGISATALEKSRHQQFRAACQAFLSKPIDVDRLLDALRNLLAFDWEYSAVQVEAPDADTAPLVPPPAEILAQLRHYASIGNFVGLTTVLDQLASDNAVYAPFCAAVRVYAERYDDDGVLAYVDQAERSAG